MTKYLSFLWKVLRIISGISAVALFAWELKLEFLLENHNSVGDSEGLGFLIIYVFILTGIAWGKRGLMFLVKFYVLLFVVSVLIGLLMFLIINPLLSLFHIDIGYFKISKTLLLIQKITAATLLVIWARHDQAKLAKSKKKK